MKPSHIVAAVVAVALAAYAIWRRRKIPHEPVVELAGCRCHGALVSGSCPDTTMRRVALSGNENQSIGGPWLADLLSYSWISAGFCVRPMAYVKDYECDF